MGERGLLKRDALIFGLALFELTYHCDTQLSLCFIQLDAIIGRLFRTLGDADSWGAAHGVVLHVTSFPLLLLYRRGCCHLWPRCLCQRIESLVSLFHVALATLEHAAGLLLRHLTLKYSAQEVVGLLALGLLVGLSHVNSWLVGTNRLLPHLTVRVVDRLLVAAMHTLTVDC